MRATLLLALLLPATTYACTAFKVTQDGRTLIGCNEDAWSINAQVRFEQGRDGQFGAIYFGHYNGSPLRAMIDQMGVNEMGLVFDGLSIQARQVTPTPGLRQSTFDMLMPLVLHTCKDVQEAAALLRTYDRSVIPHAMIFLADRHGGYLIVENDTIIEGHDPWYAVGNWRMGSCSDPDAIPIPRLQAGRALLKGGSDSSVGTATRVLESMKACRRKMGEGTLFSVLFEPADGRAHLFFYHDFCEHVTFDLKTELEKGDRTIEMASLFSARPEYEALKDYSTPFHQRALFWAMTAWLALSVVLGIVCFIWFVRDMVRLLRRRAHGPLATLVLYGLANVVLVALLTILLLNEAPYYFGLADVHPVLAWLPIVLLVLMVGFLYFRPSRGWRSIAIAQVLPIFALLGYWGLLWPWT